MKTTVKQSGKALALSILILSMLVVILAGFSEIVPSNDASKENEFGAGYQAMKDTVLSHIFEARARRTNFDKVLYNFNRRSHYEFSNDTGAIQEQLHQEKLLLKATLSLWQQTAPSVWVADSLQVTKNLATQQEMATELNNSIQRLAN